MDALDHARRGRGVVLDRWWWSTVAYGWYGARLAAAGVNEAAFRGMIDAVWSRQAADVVFLFMTPYEHDELNRDAVRDGYARLAAHHPDITIEVPASNPAATTDFILGQLVDRSLLAAHH